MSVRKEFELIIKQNITKRTRVNHFDWDHPCATSTPVRKPLNILDNFEPGFGYNQCNVLSRNISFKTTPKTLGEGQSVEGNSRKKVAKKNKPRSRGNSFYRGHDDDDDEESDDNERDEDYSKDNGSKKNLIIKLGSDQFDSKRIRKSSGGEEKKEESQSSGTKGQNEIRKKDVASRSVNNKTKSRANNSNKTVSALFAKKDGTDSGNSNGNGDIETGTSALVNDSSQNNLDKNEKDQPEPEKDPEADVISCKRKNNIARVNHVVSKKSRSDPELEVLGLSKGNGDPVKGKNIENGLDKSVKGGKTKLSNSHEIFSETKERELRDSLDMTAVSVTEKDNDDPESRGIEIVKVLKKEQKVVSKKRSYDSKNKLKLKEKSLKKNKIDAATGRSKRGRKSPKQSLISMFVDKKVNKDSVQEVNDIDNAEEVEPPSPSTTQQGEREREREGQKVMTSNNGSSHSSTNKDFFSIKEMEFIEIPPNGNEREVYSYAMGWKFPAFRCGALKIGSKCESSGRTEHENSHFGGVLLQGKLLMKIQENEVELTSGKMFCVPPLTDWKATNITKKDCILYYWCGRFQKQA